MKARGSFNNRRHWVIKMNEFCYLYLGGYSLIDFIDYIIKTFHMKYRCWKIWHSSVLFTMSLEVFVSYYMFLKVSEEDLKQTWKYNNVVDLWAFLI